MARAAASRLTTKAGKPFTKLHGSVFGGCIHSQVLALMGEEGEPPAPHMQKLFDAGHQSEAETKQWLRAQGVQVKDKPDAPPVRASNGNMFDEQIELSTWFDDREGNGILLALHLDGVLRAQRDFLDHLATGEMALWEHKALSPEKFAAFEMNGVLGVSQRYAWQVSAAIVLGRKHLAKKLPDVAPTLPLLFSVERRDYDAATKSYILSGERRFRLLREPIYSAEQIEERCKLIVHNYLDGIVPECDSEYPCDYGVKQKREAMPYEGDDECSVLYDANIYHKSQQEVAYLSGRMADSKSRLMERLGPGLWKLDSLLVDVRVDKRGRKFFSVKEEA